MFTSRNKKFVTVLTNTIIVQILNNFTRALYEMHIRLSQWYLYLYCAWRDGYLTYDKVGCTKL